MRVLFLAIALAAAAVCIEPALDRDGRTLSLRLRGLEEIARVVTRLGTDLVGRAASALDRDTATPAVASGPREPEQITEADRQKLDRLIEEKLRQ
jgi:hypothetical protein